MSHVRCIAYFFLINLVITNSLTDFLHATNASTVQGVPLGPQLLG